MSAPGKGTVTRAGYRDYIQSPEWRAMRQRYFASKMPQDCFICATPRKPGMHLHHRTYKNLGAERLMDLVPVCPDCHELIHAIFKSDKKWQTIGLWAATTKAKNMVRRRRSPVGDLGSLVWPARKRFAASNPRR